MPDNYIDPCHVPSEANRMPRTREARKWPSPYLYRAPNFNPILFFPRLQFLLILFYLSLFLLLDSDIQKEFSNPCFYQIYEIYIYYIFRFQNDRRVRNLIKREIFVSRYCIQYKKAFKYQVVFQVKNFEMAAFAWIYYAFQNFSPEILLLPCLKLSMPQKICNFHSPCRLMILRFQQRLSFVLTNENFYNEFYNL